MLWIYTQKKTQILTSLVSTLLLSSDCTGKDKAMWNKVLWRKFLAAVTLQYRGQTLNHIWNMHSHHQQQYCSWNWFPQVSLCVSIGQVLLKTPAAAETRAELVWCSLCGIYLWTMSVEDSWGFSFVKFLIIVKKKKKSDTSLTVW